MVAHPRLRQPLIAVLPRERACRADTQPRRIRVFAHEERGIARLVHKMSWIFVDRMRDPLSLDGTPAPPRCSSIFGKIVPLNGCRMIEIIGAAFRLLYSLPPLHESTSYMP